MPLNHRWAMVLAYALFFGSTASALAIDKSCSVNSVECELTCKAGSAALNCDPPDNACFASCSDPAANSFFPGPQAMMQQAHPEAAIPLLYAAQAVIGPNGEKDRLPVLSGILDIAVKDKEKLPQFVGHPVVIRFKGPVWKGNVTDIDLYRGSVDLSKEDSALILDFTSEDNRLLQALSPEDAKPISTALASQSLN